MSVRARNKRRRPTGDVACCDERGEVDVDAVSSMCPCQPSAGEKLAHPADGPKLELGRRGEARQVSATWFIAAQSSSASIPGSDAVTAK